MRKRITALAALALAASCHTRNDPRAELERAIGGANVAGYVYTFSEDANQSVAALTHPALRSGTKVGRADLRFAQVRDKKSGATRTYRTELVPAGKSATIRVTDLDTRQVVTTLTPITRLGAVCVVDDNKYPSERACNADFECSCLPAFQCEANRTCQTLFVSYDCCLTGQPICVSILRLVTPTSFRCQIAPAFPPDGGVFAE